MEGQGTLMYGKEGWISQRNAHGCGYSYVKSSIMCAERIKIIN